MPDQRQLPGPAGDQRHSRLGDSRKAHLCSAVKSNQQRHKQGPSRTMNRADIGRVVKFLTLVAKNRCEERSGPPQK
ncbi:hypothetical protein NDU88_003186 [Pleurodeles waltl]|uniref:Uncharacterized protein n=1 Tax=Pleurodeles waltl TaxID=8319 RepID=A0AAV7UDB2_PLEWA|nr:hypothetical protein NDU88_003186 [Pleurodeles waltl]